jgi:transitional endoplasmic reticulum ATPase
LLIFASIEGDKLAFANVLKDQIDILQKQLDKSFKSTNISSHPGEYQSGPHGMGPSSPPMSNQRDIRTLLDALSECTNRIGIEAALPRIYESGREISGTQSGSNRDIRALLDAVSDSLASLDLPSLRTYEAAPHRGHALEDSGNEEGKNFRALLDRMTTQKNINILRDRFYYPPPPPPKEYKPSTRGPGYRHPGAPTQSSSQRN